jgi:putative spermidine/putrescine transport system permease protein
MRAESVPAAAHATRRLFGDIGFWALIGILSAIGLLFLLLPIAIIIGASFTASEFLTFPPQGFSLRWFEELLRSREIGAAAWTSALVAGLATSMAVLIGVAAAFPIVRSPTPSLDMLAGVFVSPLVVPTVVYGLGVLLFLNISGFGFSFWALVFAHLTIVVPYIVRTTASALQLMDPELEQAAMSLGANRPRVFWHVVLPHIAPAIVTGATFAFLASFDNLIVSLFLVGPRTETLPIRIYALVEYDIDPVAAAVSALMVAITLVVAIVLERLVGLSRAFGV